MDSKPIFHTTFIIILPYYITGTFIVTFFNFTFPAVCITSAAPCSWAVARHPPVGHHLHVPLSSIKHTPPCTRPDWWTHASHCLCARAGDRRRAPDHLRTCHSKHGHQ